jgi:Coenzyme PQQ synthesis protein D (PqqD)
VSGIRIRKQYLRLRLSKNCSIVLVPEGTFMTGITMDSTVVVAKEQMSCGLDDDAVILSLEKGVYYTLNLCGNRIWSLIQKPVTVGKVRDTLLEEFDVDRATCEEDLVSLLGAMKQEGLVVIEDPAPS